MCVRARALLLFFLFLLLLLLRRFHTQSFVERREAMLAAQAAYYGTIIVGKCATLICCTTRQMSLFSHGIPYAVIALIGVVDECRNRVTLYSLVMFPLLLFLPMYAPCRFAKFVVMRYTSTSHLR